VVARRQTDRAHVSPAKVKPPINISQAHFVRYLFWDMPNSFKSDGLGEPLSSGRLRQPLHGAVGLCCTDNAR
jgi:hypothetical protein